MKNTKIILFTIITYTIVSMVSLNAKKGKTLKADKEVENFLGKRIINILKNAETIKSYKIEGKKSENGNLHGYKVLKQGTQLSKRQKKKLVAKLLKAKTYNFKTVKKCIFAPSFALRFIHQKRIVNVFFCLSCNEIKYIYRNKEYLEDIDTLKNDLRLLSYRLFKGR